MHTISRGLSREFAARTLVSLTQDISQGLTIKKIVSVNCDIPEQQKVCLDCIEFHKQEQELFNATIDMASIEQACTYACGCNVSDINMTSTVSCDFSSLLSGTITSDQVRSTMETVWQMMSIEEKVPTIDMEKARAVLQNTSTKMLSICRSDTFQSSVQDLKAKQYVVLRGKGTIHGVTIQEAIHVVEQIIETNEAATVMVNDLQSEMSTLVAELVRVSSAKLIEWVVRIVLYLVTCILLGVLVWSTISLGKTTLLMA